MFAQIFEARDHTFAMALHSLAVQIAGECDEPEAGQLMRATFRVIVESCATVDHQHARAPPGVRFIPHQQACQWGVVVAVLNRLCEHGA